MVILGLFAFSLEANAQGLTINDPNSTVNSALGGIYGGGSGTGSGAAQTSFLDEFLGMFGLGGSGGSDSSRLTANIGQGFQGETVQNHAIVLVQAPNRPEIFRIIGGRRFLIPNDTVGASYGYTSADVVPMAMTKIMTYPRVKLVQLEGDTMIYYLTESGMVRPAYNEEVFNTYADSAEAIVTINKVEFSMYPLNQYIYNENVHVVGRRPNIYRVSSGLKKLVFPDELKRLGVQESMIAPVNQAEFDSYYTVLADGSTPKQRSWFSFF